ncbi:MAG: phosphoenolpyruvate carboxykinase (ATP) [candidate division Zixibacteria bacterium]|nr:phosphoenolpyruvate carboxykinase (ATP) [candidate division Zixibacteria bacterium]
MVEDYGLGNVGIKPGRNVYRNLSTPVLVEAALRRCEGELADNGALVVRTTTDRTGRSPLDKYLVREPSTEKDIWWGKVNVPMEPAVFDRLYAKVTAYLSRKELFVFDGFVGADPRYSYGVRIVTEKAWHSLFARTLFRRPTAEQLAKHKADFTVVNACDFHALPEADGVRSYVVVAVGLRKNIILITGSNYGGEMKKGIFTIMNYLLPARDVCPMHCSINVGADGDAALFFGLSGTGKTTLSADPKRRLVGDDETGWSDDGCFNFEGGCYAKVIRLSATDEPQIYYAIRFGSLLENVIVDPATRAIDYDDGSITENTRATYPVEYIPNSITEGVSGHPKNVFFLAADAFGVLPPVAKLTPATAMYHYLSGYTAKLAGTESGIDEPQATFSAAFGAPFLPRHPTVYAKLMGERLAKHKADCWLVNTGWSGGPYGVGKRMAIGVTRGLLSAALEGVLAKQEFELEPVFNVLVPKSCPGVPAEVLWPRNTWKDKAAYDAKALELAKRFVKNFEQFEDMATEEVRAAGPRV